MVLTTLFTALALLQVPATPSQAQPQKTSAPLFANPAFESGFEYRTITLEGKDTKVSLHADRSSLKDVLGKLPKIDYVVDADTFKDRKITLELKDVGLTTALNAIASALDAHWESVGSVKVLKKGPGTAFNVRSLEVRPFTAPQGAFAFPNVPKIDAPGFKLFTRPTLDIDALLKSVTPAQKELAKKQGYLKPSDLTPEQRKLAGIAERGGTISIVISRDGETLTIKN